jgi:hypothetical protein
MKNLIYFFFVLILAACNTQKKYTNFDYSFERSGGISPVYENLLIKGNNAYYSFEGNGKKVKKDFTVSEESLKKIETAISQNNFRTIEEDYKKIYDRIDTNIAVKKGPNSGRKSDASYIMKKDEQRFNNIVAVFTQIIATNVNTSPEK